MKVNYVIRATQALHEALRRQGKDPARSLTPALQQGYVGLVLTKGELVTLADVHDIWAVARSVERPAHPDIVPFNQLTPEVQEYDRPFMLAIRDAARRLAAEKARS